MVVPYVEDSEVNFCLNEVKRTIKTGESLTHLIDANDPSDVKTYVYLQNNVGVALNPTLPSGWVLRKIEYKHDVELTFETSGNTAYVIDDQETVYLKIN